MTARILVTVLITVASTSMAAADGSTREEAIRLITQIQRADYEGDRPALRRLHDALKPFAEDRTLASRVEYWRGFALWRRAVNGFNEAADSTEQAHDLAEAVNDFLASSAADTTFVDAKIGGFSCLGLLMFLNQKNPARIQELAPRGMPMFKDLQATAPEHPRFLWVAGPLFWTWPPERGGGEEKAMAGYRRGLETLRKRDRSADDPLEPSWGEPEMLMSLAWSSLNRKTPDLDAAEAYAKSALELVPYWHYVRDILMTQILEARAAGK